MARVWYAFWIVEFAWWYCFGLIVFGDLFDKNKYTEYIIMRGLHECIGSETSVYRYPLIPNTSKCPLFTWERTLLIADTPLDCGHILIPQRCPLIYKGYTVRIFIMSIRKLHKQNSDKRLWLIFFFFLIKNF